MLFLTHNLETRMIEAQDQHSYTNDGENFFPSVTLILDIIDKGENFKTYLKSNGFNANYLLREAMELGQLAHQLTERFDVNPETPILQRTYDANGKVTYEYDLKAWAMLSRYVDFRKRFPLKMLAIEQVLCSEKLGYGGTVDRICEINGERYLIDIKTGEHLYGTYDYQLMAYKMLWEENFPAYPIDKLAILHLNADIRTMGKNNDIQGIKWKLRPTVRDWEELKDGWDSTLKLWKIENPGWKPYFMQYSDHFCAEELGIKNIIE